MTTAFSDSVAPQREYDGVVQTGVAAGRRPDTCPRCAASMARGEAAHVFSRPRGWRLFERVRVCAGYFNEWATSRRRVSQ